MLRGVSGRALSRTSKAPVTLSTRAYTSSTRNVARTNTALVLSSSVVAAGTLWYLNSRNDIIRNDAPPAGALETGVVDVSKVTLDDELSMLVWGSNK